MGRCYEFGVSIDPTSEHAMVVAPEGGHCVCPSTGASCFGQFAGCVDIVAQPERIPPNAPAWSRPNTTVDTMLPTPGLVAATTGHAQIQTPPPPVSQPVRSVAVQPMPLTHSALVPPNPVMTPPAPISEPAAGAPVSDLANVLDVVQQLQAEFHAEQLRPDTRLTGIEQSLELLTERLAVPAPTVDVEPHFSALTETLQAMKTDHEQALAAFHTQTASLHETVENLAQMVVLARQETAENAERHRRELHGVRHQLIELRASIDERTEASAQDRVDGDIRSIREAVEGLESRTPPDLLTANQLAETLNSLRDAGAEEISTAHLVHSFQLEVRSLREQLDELIAGVSDTPTPAAVATP